MRSLGIFDFTTQRTNNPGQETDVLLERVPRGYNYGIGRNDSNIIYMPFYFEIKMVEGGAAAKTPTFLLDYAWASQNATNPIGNNIIVEYSEDGITYTQCTMESASGGLSALGEAFLSDQDTGEIEVYLPASDTLWFRVFYRPREGRLMFNNYPALPSQASARQSVGEWGLGQLHQRDQVNALSRLVLGPDSVHPSSSQFGFSILTDNDQAAQTSETDVTKTLISRSVFAPRTGTNGFTEPWDTYEVGLIDLPLQVVK